MAPSPHLQTQIQAAIVRMEKRGWDLRVQERGDRYGVLTCPYGCVIGIALEYANPGDLVATFESGHAQHLRAHGE